MYFLQNAEWFNVTIWEPWYCWMCWKWITYKITNWMIELPIQCSCWMQIVIDKSDNPKWNTIDFYH